MDRFVQSLRSKQSPWGTVKVSLEFDYQRGRPDILAVTDEGHLIAFEVKLTKWREALHQAYRNTSFAHCSYVVLPQEIALKAQRLDGEFALRKVGICYIENEQIVIAFAAEKQLPLEPWLMKTACAAVFRQNDSAR